MLDIIGNYSEEMRTTSKHILEVNDGEELPRIPAFMDVVMR